MSITALFLSVSFQYNNIYSLGLIQWWFHWLAGQKQQSVDQFLSRLPQSVIKDGKIIDVRSGVANIIKVCNSVAWNMAPSTLRNMKTALYLWWSVNGTLKLLVLFSLLAQFCSKDPKSTQLHCIYCDFLLCHFQQGGEGHSDVKVLDTPVLQEIKSR